MYNHNDDNTISSEYFSNSIKTTLSVIMPAYNEGAAIFDNLMSASSTISSFCSDFIIIVVNDGSSDNTEAEILKAAAKDSHIKYISYKKNRGKGGAISLGVKYANSKYVAFLDSDLELPPSMLENFISELEANNADIAIGSKMYKDSELVYPITRKILSLGYYIFLKFLFRLKIKDTQTGIKLFKTAIIQPICASISSNGFAYDIEILAKASKRGFKIIELPITLHFNRDRSEKSRFSPKVILNIFKETLKVKKAVKKF